LDQFVTKNKCKSLVIVNVCSQIIITKKGTWLKQALSKAKEKS